MLQNEVRKMILKFVLIFLHYFKPTNQIAKIKGHISLSLEGK